MIDLTVTAGAIVVLALLACLLPAWRRVMGGAQDLPFRRFLKRRGAALEGPAALRAEVGCAMCDSKALCRSRLAAGADAPPAGCPNAELFAGASAGASRATAVPKG